MNNIYKLIYVSRETQPISEAELLEILDKARSANAEKGITGLLLYNNGCIIQLLEGEETTVEQLYKKIELDTRHTGLLRLYSTHTDQRDFPNWNMGFERIDPTALQNQQLSALANQQLNPDELSKLSKEVQIFINAFRTTAGLDR